MITVAELASYFPHVDEQLGEVLTERVNRAPAACREHLDSTRALIGGAVIEGDDERGPGPDQETGGNSENISSMGEPSSDGGNVRLDLDEVLDCLGWVDGEFTAVCHRPIGGEFFSSVVKSVDASAHVKRLPEKECIWFSVNPTAGPERHNQGRGREREVSRWAGLYLDVDVKDGAFPDLDKAAEYISVLSGMVGTRPSVIIYSGHGLQPLWPIEDAELNTDDKWGRAYRLSRRFGRLATKVVEDFAPGLDNVSDLSRILRIPGTTNWKDPANPAEVYAVRDTGAPLAIKRVEEFLDEWAPEIESDEPMLGKVVSSPDTWRFGQATCPYVATIIRAIPTDTPKAGRHQWMVSKCVKLASAQRLGCISESDFDRAAEQLHARLVTLRDETGEEVLPYEVPAAMAYAVETVSCKTDEQTRAELGDHTRREKGTFAHSAPFADGGDPCKDGTFAQEDKKGDTQPDYEKDVDKKLHDLRVLDEAKRRFAIEKAGDAPSFEARLLRDVPVFSPAESFRIAEVMPSDGSTVINAQNKTGKTTFTLNMARCFLTSENFLGRFRVRPVDGRVAILNYEVADAQLGYWARQVGVPEDRFVQVDLRGRRNPFAHPDDLKHLAEMLKGHQVESLIVDPFGQAFPGTNQDNAGEVGGWLADLNRWARGVVGVSDLILNVHAGWNQERARGSSVLGDWPDSTLYLTRADGADDRYVRALGRDVYLDEDRLDYDPDTRLLTLSGAGGRQRKRSQAKAEALLDPLYAQAQQNPGASQKKLINLLQDLHRSGALKVSFQEKDVVKTIELAIEKGKLRREDDGQKGTAYRHFLIEEKQPPPTSARPPLSDGTTTSATAYIGGGST